MFFDKKGNKRVTSLTKIVAVFMSAVIVALLTGAVIDLQSKRVTLAIIDEFADTEKTQELTTRQNTVLEFLNENNVALGEFDKTNIPLGDELTDNAYLTVRRGKTFTVTMDGNVQIMTTTENVLRDALLENGIMLNDSDYSEPGLDSKITDDFSATLYRIVTEEVTTVENIPFTTKRVSDSTLAKGVTKIKTRGLDGTKNVTYAVTTENGVETKRELVSESVEKEPVTQVVLVGTKPATKKQVVTNAGETLTYSRKLTVTATAYTASSGKKTASGRVAQYGVIAVDPKVIPLGTRLYVESTDDGKTWQYGYCIAGDTGGAIKGNKIDLFFNSRSECLQFGRKSAIVYVLD